MVRVPFYLAPCGKVNRPPNQNFKTLGDAAFKINSQVESGPHFRAPAVDVVRDGGKPQPREVIRPAQGSRAPTTKGSHHRKAPG